MISQYLCFLNENIMEKPVQVLFVCLGNICRSPMAEGLFLHHVKAAGLSDQIEVDSAGTSGWHTGERPDPRMVETASRHGVELVSFGRQLTAEDFDRFDYVIVMDSSNYHEAKKLMNQSGHSRASLVKMMEFHSSRLGIDVPDPYYGGKQGFEQVYEMLDEATKGLLAHIRAEHKL